MSEAEISLLFDWARTEIEQVEAMAKGGKKRIVKELAAKLESKLAIDTIAAEIVTQLRGVVSERFVYECLEEKYKTKTKPSKNSKKNAEPQSAAAEESPKQLVATTNSGASVSEPEVKTHLPELQNAVASETKKVAQQIVNSSMGIVWTRVEVTRIIPGSTVSFDKKIDICKHNGGIFYVGAINGNASEILSATEFIKRGLELEAKA